MFGATSFYRPQTLVNHEALAVLSSYSPATLAMHDMLKQQLQLTRYLQQPYRSVHPTTML